jgi:Mg/Co/Ni transporter MgtE
MSEDRTTLALAFLHAHPDAAAATLEQHEVSEVATFLAGIPQSYSAPVLQQMLPHFAVQICSLLPREQVVGIFSFLEIGHIAALLRYLDNDQRQEILKDLSTKNQIGCSLLLNYSEDLVGAWITPQVATIPFDCSVQEALNYLKITPDVVHTDFLYTVNRERELKGRVRLVNLLKEKKKMPVSSFSESLGETLSGRTRINVAVNNEAWKNFHEIPVLNRNNKFIGVLRQTALRKALDHLAPLVGDQVPISSITSVSAVYGETLVALFDSMKQIAESDIRS